MTHRSTHTNVAVLHECVRTDVGENAPGKHRGRPFRRGQSGNPAGRPKGARNRTTMAAEALLEGEAEALTRKCIELALAGDTMALKLCMERVVPPRRDRTITFEFPSMNHADEIATAVDAILVAVSRGEITPSEAAAVLSLIETKRRLSENRNQPPIAPPEIRITFNAPEPLPSTVPLALPPRNRGVLDQ